MFVSCRGDALAVFGDASGQLLRWCFSSNAKLALLAKLGSRVCCLAAAPGAAAEQQQLQQVRVCGANLLLLHMKREQAICEQS